MTKALSVDLRERVVAVIDGGLSRRQAAARFGVSVSSAIRWHALARQTGTAMPRQQGGDRRSGRVEAHGDVILAAVAKQPDITLAELCELLAGTVSALASRRFGGSSRGGRSRSKKSGHAAEQDRPDVVSRREAWFEGQLDLDPHTLVFIDETGPAPRWRGSMVERREGHGSERVSRMATGRQQPSPGRCGSPA